MGLVSNEKIADIWHFEWIKGIGVKYCWNYRSSKLLLHFIEYHLDQLNSKLIKIAVNSAMKAAVKLKMSAKSLKFFDPPTTKWRPCKIFAKLKENHLLMANLFKLHEYQTFGLMKIHNMCKIWFANKKFCLWKTLVYDYWAVENGIF